MTDSLAMRGIWAPWRRDTVSYPFCPSPAGQLNLPVVISQSQASKDRRNDTLFFLTLLSSVRNEITTANSSHFFFKCRSPNERPCYFHYSVEAGPGDIMSQDTRLMLTSRGTLASQGALGREPSRGLVKSQALKCQVL